MEYKDGLPKLDKIPPLSISGPTISPKDHVEPGTGLHSFIGNFVLLFVGILAIFGSQGALLVVIIFLPIINYFANKKIMALINGSCLKVNRNQFPEIYECIKETAKRLGMKKIPAAYIVEGNVMQTAAVKLGKRNIILLVDDIVYSCLQSGEPKVLSFVIAREMAQYALGHHGTLRALKRGVYKKLSRLDEYTYDRIANAIVGDPQVSIRTLTTLLAGPQILKYVNFEEIIMQAQDVDRDKDVKKVVNQLPQPALMQRIIRFVN